VSVVECGCRGANGGSAAPTPIFPNPTPIPAPDAAFFLLVSLE
jgi:hypothetical protein